MTRRMTTGTKMPPSEARYLACEEQALEYSVDFTEPFPRSFSFILTHWSYVSLCLLSKRFFSSEKDLSIMKTVQIKVNQMRVGTQKLWELNTWFLAVFTY